MLFVALAFAGLAVLGVCTVKVFAAVRGLGRELTRTRERLETEQQGLQRELGRPPRGPA